MPKAKTKAINIAIGLHPFWGFAHVGEPGTWPPFTIIIVLFE